MATKKGQGETVPETVLKKRKRNEQWAEKQAERKRKEEANAKKRQELAFKRAEQYVKEYRQEASSLYIIPFHLQGGPDR